MRRIILSAVIALIAFAACVVLPVLAVQNLWRVTGYMDIPEVTQVLAQLQEAAFVPGWIPAAICAAAVFAIAFFMRRHPVVAGILTFFMLLAGIICALLALKVNGVPMLVMVKIVMEYVRLGAF